MADAFFDEVHLHSQTYKKILRLQEICAMKTYQTPYSISNKLSVTSISCNRSLKEATVATTFATGSSILCQKQSTRFWRLSDRNVHTNYADQ